jgi:hypothetical protein
MIDIRQLHKETETGHRTYATNGSDLNGIADVLPMFPALEGMLPKSPG